MSNVPPGPDHEPPYPSPAYSWYVVVVLTLAYMLSFLDRQIMALMVQPIKRDLGISDTAMSLLLGLAFAIFYTILGLPIGRWADRASRRGIIGGGIALWCLMTAACGLARDYWTLFLARIGVGVGEATLAPSALSLISDYFPKEKRGQALSFYNAGVGLGAAVAMILGGQVIQYVSTQPPVELPVLGQLYAWQTVFLVVGLPGLLVAALMLTVKEPFRRGKMKRQVAAGASDEIPVAEVVQFLKQRWKMFASHFVGMSVVTILGYAYFSWLPTTFIRTWGWSIGQISLAYGIIMIVTVPLGVNFGGWLSDRLYKQGHKDGHMRSNLYGVAIFMAGPYVLVPLMPTPELALFVLVFGSIGGAWVTATGAASLMMICPNQMRGQITALYYFVISILGLTVGPSAVAIVTDFVFKDEAMLRYSLALTCGVATMFAIVLLVYNLKYFRAGVAEAQQWLGGPGPKGSR
ncbi:MAG: MFS transporter [Rhodospirillaceae bacterium]|nr:MFS transporter [Rhodospirillaceae bacterium]